MIPGTKRSAEQAFGRPAGQPTEVPGTGTSASASASTSTSTSTTSTKHQRTDPAMEIDLPTGVGFDETREDHRETYAEMMARIEALLGFFGFDMEYSGRNDTFNVFERPGCDASFRALRLVAHNIKFHWDSVGSVWLGEGKCVRVRAGPGTRYLV